MRNAGYVIGFVVLLGDELGTSANSWLLVAAYAICILLEFLAFLDERFRAGRWRIPDRIGWYALAGVAASFVVLVKVPLTYYVLLSLVILCLYWVIVMPAQVKRL